MEASGKKALTQRIIRARNNIRRKFQELKRVQADTDMFFKTKLGPPLQDLFKPTTPKPTTTSSVSTQTLPLELTGVEEQEEQQEEEEEDVFTSETPVRFLTTQTVAETPTTSKQVPSLSEVLSTPEYNAQLKRFLRTAYGPLTTPYLKKLFSKKTDTTYGVRYEEDRFRIGKADIKISDRNIVVQGVSYKTTKGLLELLFMRIPDSYVITDDDLQKYKSILLATDGFRRNYDSSESVNANKSYKYREYISRLFPTRHVSARGLTYKPLLPYVDVTYWNDANVLVERLHLLMASRHAGHTGHDAEILAIEDELRRAGIIA